MAPEGSTLPVGTSCVARCNPKSCRNGGICTPAVDDISDVTCACPSPYTGDTCEIDSGALVLADWAVILIAILAGLAACIGVSLCVYTCYKVFCKKGGYDDDSDTNSIYSFKPKAIPTSEYDRITDIGSVSRADNHGYASTIDEEQSEYGDVHSVVSIKNDGLKFGSRISASRLSIPSEYGDPTPVMDPYNRTDRHAVSESDIISNPDYY